jgi:hypothetical protein
MRFVTCSRALYRVTERNYRRLMLAIARNEEVDINKFGIRLGVIDADITKLDPYSGQLALGTPPRKR